ncbi:response regulator transcription factor [Actinoplanes sp. NPDC023714]|uniref:response regulator transcription factor n=1 Tax=Actinoplanes sp. NPDC023714 TaxID=3154322 RepID=UPI0033FBC8D7
MLIVDDETDHRDLLTLALRRLGYAVVAAEDADGALAALATGDVDAALIDVRMPGESGLDLCRRLRADPRTEFLPIMMVSADAQRGQVMTALCAGADDYLVKPFSRAELAARLEAMTRLSPASALRSTAAARAAALAASRSFRIEEQPARLRRIA